MFHLRFTNVVLLADEAVCHSDANRINPGSNQMTDKHADYLPNRNEITVYYTHVQYSPPINILVKSAFIYRNIFSYNEMIIIFLKLASNIALRCPCIMQSFIKAVKMVVLDKKNLKFLYQNIDRGYTL